MSRICLLCRENETTGSDKTCQLCQENACDILERNADLFAAAPDLFDAASLAVVSMKDALDGNQPGWMDNMRADLDFIEKAIAKAA